MTRMRSSERGEEMRNLDIAQSWCIDMGIDQYNESSLARLITEIEDAALERAAKHVLMLGPGYGSEHAAEIRALKSDGGK